MNLIGLDKVNLNDEAAPGSIWPVASVGRSTTTSLLRSIYHHLRISYYQLIRLLNNIVNMEPSNPAVNLAPTACTSAPLTSTSPTPLAPLRARKSPPTPKSTSLRVPTFYTWKKKQPVNSKLSLPRVARLSRFFTSPTPPTSNSIPKKEPRFPWVTSFTIANNSSFIISC